MNLCNILDASCGRRHRHVLSQRAGKTHSGRADVDDRVRLLKLRFSGNPKR